MIKVKLLRRPKQSHGAVSTGSGGFAGSIGNVSDFAAEAAHAAEADRALLADRALEAEHTPEADHAKTAGALDPDSPTRDEFLSRVHDDTASGLITFLLGLISNGKITALGDGIQFGEVFVPGIAGGIGGKIDAQGRAELLSLVLRAFLEVPELRFNRTEVSVGNDWNAPGGGLIRAAWPDTAADGTVLPSGIAELHLEKGEAPAVSAGDICMGIFHCESDLTTNAATDSDDGRGNFTFAGFRTVYFRVTETLGDGSRFRYSLRPVSDRWKGQWHPSSQMTFVAYGSFTNPERQTSRYSTRTYTRFLRRVSDWEFSLDNIGAQFGDLGNVSIPGRDLGTYAAYLDNVFVRDRIHYLNVAPLRVQLEYDYDNTIDYTESRTIRARAFKGDTEVTADSWSITRDTGDAAADAAWAASAVVASDGSITIGWDDLGEIPSTLFSLTATYTDPDRDNATAETATAGIALRRANNGAVYTMRFAEGEYIPPQQPANVYIPLTVQIFYCGRDITSEVPDSAITWTRYTEDNDHNPRTGLDAAWAAKMAGAGKAVVLRTVDIDLDSVGPTVIRFTATAEFPDKAAPARRVRLKAMAG